MQCIDSTLFDCWLDTEFNAPMYNDIHTTIYPPVGQRSIIIMNTSMLQVLTQYANLSSVTSWSNQYQHCPSNTPDSYKTLDPLMLLKFVIWRSTRCEGSPGYNQDYKACLCCFTAKDVVSVMRHVRRCKWARVLMRCCVQDQSYLCACVRVAPSAMTLTSIVIVISCASFCFSAHNNRLHV